MASRDDLYRKFGITAEAAQLFETELGTLLLAARGLEKGWHVEPDPDAAGKVAEEIDGHTLGMLLNRLRGKVEFDQNLSEKLASALGARNRLMHGFFERHNFKIDTDEGRDLMIADLERLHDELFQAWQLTSAMTKVAVEYLATQKSAKDGGGGGVGGR